MIPTKELNVLVQYMLHSEGVLFIKLAKEREDGTRSNPTFENQKLPYTQGWFTYGSHIVILAAPLREDMLEKVHARH